jgi:hypothetical protein
MEFAVVEYSSKSGNIWRHTDERPNYLCDPVTEIDPTSFGCYASALKGQHIPLTGLITNSIHPSFRLYRKAFKRLTKHWPNYSLNYLQSFDVLLFVHQLSETQELNRALKRLRQLNPRPFIIGVPTQPFGILQNAFQNNSTCLQDFNQFMSLCDVFISIVKSTVPYYQSHTSTPVAYLPQPYPAIFASKNFIPLSQKEPAIFVAGVTQRDNIKKGQLIARELQKQYPDHKILIPKVHDLDYDFQNLKDTNYEILPFEAWQQHLATLAKVKLVINTDYTFTRGRVQTDCAAVGNPSVGSNSDAQIDLFPQELYSQKDTPIEGLILAAKKLLNDSTYYQTVTSTALQNLMKYEYKESAHRLQALVKKYHHA